MQPTNNPSNQDSTVIQTVEQMYPETCAEFRKLLQDEYELFCKKQHDYGSGNISLGSNLEKAEDRDMSVCSIIFRIYDKTQRLLNLIVRSAFKSNRTQPANESIEDAFIDLSCYSKIALIVRRGKWGK